MPHDTHGRYIAVRGNIRDFSSGDLGGLPCRLGLDGDGMLLVAVG